MRRTIPVLLLLTSLLTSCASLVRNHSSRIHIHPEKRATFTVQGIDYRDVQRPFLVKAKSKQGPLQIGVRTDSTSRQVTVQPVLWWYPRHVYINPHDPRNTYSTFKGDRQGQLYLEIGIPAANVFLLRPFQEPVYHSAGFLGLSTGLDYYHHANQFLQIKANILTDHPVPFPVGIDHWGEYDITSSAYFSLSNNHQLGRLILGYGAAYSIDTWEHIASNSMTAPPVHAPVNKSHHALGLLFSTHYYTGPRFKIGVVYRPSFYSFSPVNAFQYQHLISLDLGWRIKLR